MRQRGFSLLEILVAFTILALSLGILMQIFSGSLRNAEVARDQAQATALAQSLLAGPGIETTLAPGESSGNFGDKFRWRVVVAPFEEAAPPAENAGQRPPSSLALWQVTALVTWAGGQTAEKQSQKKAQQGQAD